MSFADLPISAFSVGRGALPRLGHRQLRGHLGPILSEIHQVRGAVEIVNDGEREVVVLDHDVFDELVFSKRDATALRDSLPLMLAAAAAGIAIPSTTLDQLGLQLPVDAEALKRFRSGYPVRHTHDEDGTPLTFVDAVAVDTVGEAADEDDIVLIELDD